VPKKTRSHARERLIESAGPIFARLGYEAATVTPICAEAGCNIAAINYHFGDKASLYREVIKVAVTIVSGIQTADQSDGKLVKGKSLEEELFDAMRKSLARFLRMTAEDWHFVLVGREFLQPTLPASDPLSQKLKILSPSQPWLPLVSKATGLKPDDPHLQWVIYCMLAPMLLLGIKPEAMARQFPALKNEQLDLEAFCKHSARQLVAGVVSVRKASAK